MRFRGMPSRPNKPVSQRGGKRRDQRRYWLPFWAIQWDRQLSVPLRLRLQGMRWKRSGRARLMTCQARKRHKRYLPLSHKLELCRIKRRYQRRHYDGNQAESRTV